MAAADGYAAATPIMDETAVAIVEEGAESTPAEYAFPDIDSFTSEQRADWLKNGIPTTPQAKADPPPAKESSAALPAETAPVPEPGSKQEPPKKNAESRKAELAAEIQELLVKRNALKTEIEGKGVKEPAKSPAAEPVEPDLQTFPGDWDAYLAAVTDYRAKYKAWLVGETQKSTKAAVEAEFQQRQTQQERAKFIEQGVTKHGAQFKEHLATLDAALPENLQIALSSMGDVAGLVNHLATNPAVLKALTEKFAANPFSAIAELGRIESALTTPAKQEASTKAPRPPANIAGHGSGEGSDPIRAAVEAGDTETYNRLMNAREMRKRA